MKEIRYYCALIGAVIGRFLGGMDGALIALTLFMAMDYATGVMLAFQEKKLSSGAGFKGIARKALILLLVGMAHTLDLYVLGEGSMLRGSIICFYLANEGISILENAANMGLPVPEKLKNALSQISETKKEESKS